MSYPDNPDLIAVTVVGDGEAESHELAQQRVPQPDPRRGGAAGARTLPGRLLARAPDPTARHPLRPRAAAIAGTVLNKRTSELFREFAVAHADGSIGRFLVQLSRIDILLLDDFAMASLKHAERRDFLEICDDRSLPTPLHDPDLADAGSALA